MNFFACEGAISNILRAKWIIISILAYVVGICTGYMIHRRFERVGWVRRFDGEVESQRLDGLWDKKKS